jgi:hypothetical protein
VSFSSGKIFVLVVCKQKKKFLWRGQDLVIPDVAGYYAALAGRIIVRGLFSVRLTFLGGFQNF